MTLVHDEGKINKDAVEQALQAFGQPGKAAVLSYLKRNRIVLQDDRCSPAEDIEGALENVFGSGAQLVMQLMASRSKPPAF